MDERERTIYLQVVFSFQRLERLIDPIVQHSVKDALIESTSNIYYTSML